VAELYFTDDADRQLAALEADPKLSRVVAKLHETLGRLETDQLDPRVRRERFTTGHWVVPVRAAGETWVILWQPYEDSALVSYVGEDFR
jgi:hypothetical protein